MQALQELLHVGGKVERVRYDNEVEALPEVESLASLNVKFAGGAAFAGGGDLFLGQIDSDLSGGIEPSQEFARAAADLEH